MPKPTYGATLNPYGVPYPTTNIGVNARGGTSSISTPGNVMPNFKFLGYANATPGSATDASGDPQPISLSDFYDPAGKKYKVVHLNVAAVWCGPCNDETDTLTCTGVGTPSPDYCDSSGVTAAQLAQSGVVLFSALTEGSTMGTGSTVNDLKAWISGKKIDYNMAIDPEQANLGIFFSEAAIPWNADLDARTMEILDAPIGFDSTLVSGMQEWVSWVNSNPPSYGCPAKYKLSGNNCVAD
jgi:hypothetical protein